MKHEIVCGFLSLDPPTRDQVLLAAELLGKGDFADVKEANARYALAFTRLAKRDVAGVRAFKAAVDRHLTKPATDFEKWLNQEFRETRKPFNHGAYFYSRAGDQLFVALDPQPSMALYSNPHVTHHKALKGEKITGVTINNLREIMAQAKPVYEQTGTQEFRVRQQLEEILGTANAAMTTEALEQSLGDREQRIDAALELCNRLGDALEGLGSGAEGAKNWLRKVRVALAGGKA